MMWLVIGVIVFFGTHSVAIFSPTGREYLATRYGLGWRAFYSILSLVGLALIIWGYGLARQEPLVLYQPPAWLRSVVALLMLPVFPLLFAAYLPGRIKAKLKHPMLAAVKLWALAHLLANGTLADVVLFGAFLAWAVVDRISFKHRVQRVIPSAPPGRWNDLIAVVLGLGAYLLFVLVLHARWIGVPIAP
ncbi:MAG TPA: NnrU family protein [Steroidobacteraceae bacterium]|nr:NnrU family protein [Steroidobacteraceae bacterium]